MESYERDEIIDQKYKLINKIRRIANKKNYKLDNGIDSYQMAMVLLDQFEKDLKRKWNVDLRPRFGETVEEMFTTRFQGTIFFLILPLAVGLNVSHITFQGFITLFGILFMLEYIIVRSTL